MLGNNFSVDKENVQKSASIIFLGDHGSGKSVLRQSLSPITKKTSPLQFSYFSTDTYKVLAYELVAIENLLDLTLKKKNLDEAIGVICIDLSKPEKVMESLIRYISTLKSHIGKIDPERDATNSKISWLNYSQYLDCEGFPRENRLNTVFNESLIGHAASLNFGLKMVIVGTRSEILNSDSEITDFMHQSLRAICLLFGMPLLYVSEEIPSTIERFRDYILHYSFSQIYSSNLQLRSDDWGFPSPPEYLEREKTFIPAGWDTMEMIVSFSDQTKYNVSEYFCRKATLLEWAQEYYFKNFHVEIKPKLEFTPVNEQDFLSDFMNLNASDSSVEQEEPARIPLKINNLDTTAGSSQNEVLSNFFKSLLAKKS